MAPREVARPPGSQVALLHGADACACVNARPLGVSTESASALGAAASCTFPEASVIPQKKQSAAVSTEEAEAAHEGPRPASPRRSHWGAGGRRKRGANRGASLGVSGVSQAAGA